MFSFTLISNIAATCKNKTLPSSGSEMVLKELESPHLSSFSVNLTNTFKVIPNMVGKLSLNIVKNCFLSPSWDPPFLLNFSM